MSTPVMSNFPLSMAKGLKKNPNFDGTIIQKTAAAVGNSGVSVKPYPTWDFEFDLDNVLGNESLANSVISSFMGIFMQCQGQAGLFYFLDPQDNFVSAAQFGIGDGTTTKFQLSRGINGATDIIQNPFGTPQIYINGVLQAGTYSISSTGVVTFTSAPSIGAVIAWTGSFYFLCRFSADTVSAVRSFTTNNGTDQWNVDSIKFSSEFVASSASGTVFAGGGSSGSFLVATPLAVLLNPTGAQTITGSPLFVTGLGSESANPLATSGFILLSKSDTIDWRNNANSADLALGINGSNQLVFNGSVVVTGSVVTSFNSRTGVVVPTSGDYSFSQISGTLTAGQEPSTTVNSVINDTNVTGSIAAQALTLGWAGTLAKPRTLATTVYTDQANTFGAFLQKFQAGTNFDLVDPTDTTKVAQLGLSNIATGTTRTINVPNANSTTVQSSSAAAHQFATGISAQGVVAYGQPAFTDISGVATSGQLPTDTAYVDVIQTWTAAQTFNSGDLKFAGATSGTTTVNASATASGVLTLPAATDQLVARATTDTFTNKTIDSATNTIELGGKPVSIATLSTNQLLQYNGTNWVNATVSASTVAFSGISSATNTTAAMVVGTGASLAVSGTGTIAATSSAALSISGQTALLTFTGLTTTNRAKTVRDAADTILELGGSYTPTGTWTNLTMVAPTLGAASATSINKVAITAPATSATLTIANGKTLTASNTLTLAGTDSTTQTFPASPPTGGTLAYGVLSKQIFTAGGTFTIPTGVTAVKVTVTGAGGAGGGATTTSNASGTGGFAGGTAIKWLSGLTPGNTLTVTVGTGGTGVANAGGNSGGNSTVASGTQTITTITGGGGGGGVATGNVVGYSGGGSTNGDINISGGSPSMALCSFSNAGSVGGNSMFGCSDGHPGFTGAGRTATTPGCGGGGAGGGAAGAVAGGNGAPGIVIFEWAV